MHSLLRRPALPVHSGGGHRLGKPGGEHGVPGGVHRLLANLINTPPDHIVNHPGLNPGTLHNGPKHMGKQVHRMHPGQRPTNLALPNRRPNRRNHHRIPHHNLLTIDTNSQPQRS
ncbi:hypothetical protein GCM10010492_56990 [Saccharothrix mutabilis subsp. mutabilis]|uniref:Uncharacterized protein n=1 Tax=Saccharothrix mutabilis subsp. mutabilis TaxID=66855 RepID=A0ABN0UG79_9PSEU